MKMMTQKGQKGEAMIPCLILIGIQKVKSPPKKFKIKTSFFVNKKKCLSYGDLKIIIK